MHILYRSIIMLSTIISLRSCSIRALASAAAPSYISSVSTTSSATGATTDQATAKVHSGLAFLSTPHELRVVQVQIVHRHGDRSPITPLLNESYWASELVPEELSKRVSSTTTIVRDASQKENTHLAGGRGPFGKLTQLGLLQMVQVGTELREQLVLELTNDSDDTHESDPHHVDEHGHVHWNRGRLFDSGSNPLHPSKLKVLTTDFPRTIQSVQGTLVGLFPDPADIVEPIPVDARHTNTMIPDPQPRRSVEQEELERSLASRPHLREMEKHMKELAVQTTESLRHLLSEDAFTLSFGVGEEKDDDDDSAGAATTKLKPKTKPLSWAQLSEITKCLETRDMLPADITPATQESISKHTAWRWFENLRHPRLAFLAMNTMVNTMMIKAMQDQIDHLSGVIDASSSSLVSTTSETPPLLYIYSAHDSTLIGLLCAFRLEQPAKWPEYGSYFKAELIEARPINAASSEEQAVRYLVRFSLNGEVLRCKWEDDECDTEPLHMIPVELLSEYVSTKGATATV
jgi:hypothetical protein